MGELIVSEQVLTLLTNHQRRLVGYLRKLVPNRTDAEEILQEVNLYVWRHADEFKPGSDFSAWVLRVAHFCVLAWRERQSRDRLVFDDELLEQLAVAAQSFDTQLERRRTALEGCLKKLAPHEQDLITQLYGEVEISPQRLAERVGRTVNAIYVSVHRIRTRLFDCIRQTIASEDRR